MSQSGEINCPFCQGSGKCPGCKGTGKVSFTKTEPTTPTTTIPTTPITKETSPSPAPSPSSSSSVDPSTFRGVNFADKRMFAKESRDFLTFSSPSIYQRLQEVKNHGYNHIRAPFSWEGYVKNSTAFVAGLNEIATAADQLGITVLYDFHQSSAGSHFGSGGIGFPYMVTGHYKADLSGQKAFWADLYNNAVQYASSGPLSGSSTKIWDHIANFMNDIIVAQVDSHASTAGYELINETSIVNCDNYKKIGDMYTYIFGKMRTKTEKPLHFDRPEVPWSDCPWWKTSDGTQYEKLILPRGITNVVFHAHIYDKGSATNRLNVVLNLANNYFSCPAYIGEWGQHSGDGIDQNLMQTYMSTFKGKNVGWAYWIWDPLWTYALKTQSYSNTQYMGMLDNARKAVYGGA